MSKKFYQSINDYYDYIFPLNQRQVEFVNSQFADKNSKLIEVGCANGKLTSALNDYNISGIDLEKSFIDVAKVNYPDIKFTELNMLDIDKLNGSFDGIICFGNTLVHINFEQISKFFEKCYAKLNDGGKVLIQILNYDYILNSDVKSLPLIDNDKVRFERKYEHGSKFLFNTRLEIKSNQRIIENSVPLTPIRKDRLTTIVQNSGFKNISLYGDFEKHALNAGSLPLVLSATK